MTLSLPTCWAPWLPPSPTPGVPPLAQCAPWGMAAVPLAVPRGRVTATTEKGSYPGLWKENSVGGLREPSLKQGPQLIIICKWSESRQGEAPSPGPSPWQPGVLQDTKLSSVSPSSWGCPQPRQ